MIVYGNVLHDKPIIAININPDMVAGVRKDGRLISKVKNKLPLGYWFNSYERACFRNNQANYSFKQDVIKKLYQDFINELTLNQEIDIDSHFILDTMFQKGFFFIISKDGRVYSEHSLFKIAASLL